MKTMQGVHAQGCVHVLVCVRVRQDLRYIVIPARPEGTEGWSEAELAALVTRDSMLGVTRVRGPTPGVA
jgi:hypothetical protein